MPYSQLFYHIVWATKGRAPLITPKIEDEINRLIAAKAVKMGGRVYAINGEVDHRHVVASIPPSIAIASFIGQMKGVSSGAVNTQRLTDTRFHWQDEYGVFSFDSKRLPNYLSYVRDQKQHHANGTIIPILERVSEDDYTFREEEALYCVEDPTWRAELESLSVTYK
ncbi:MAG: IS200/IS605 family transposase [Armatimonadota bacterium]